MECPTVRIMTENGPVVINETDYNPETHTLEGEDGPRKGAPVANPAPVSYNVAKFGKKYFVVDATGNKVSDVATIDPAGYADAADAWKAALPAASANS